MSIKFLNDTPVSDEKGDSLLAVNTSTLPHWVDKIAVARRLIDYFRGIKPSQPSGEESRESPDRTDELTILEDKIDYRFQIRDLLRQAITHKSFAHEFEDDSSFHNESLEFLGDSVLGFLITDRIYHAFPSVNEGRLSKIKAFLVSSSTLSIIAQQIDLPQHLRLGKGEEKTGGRKKKALSANAFEAVLAAIYLDAGMEKVGSFLEPLFDPLIEDIRTGRAIVEDAKTTLQEYLQARNLPPAHYVVTNETGPEHRKIFHVKLAIGTEELAVATGTTKKSAETQAAQIALTELKSRNE